MKSIGNKRWNFAGRKMRSELVFYAGHTNRQSADCSENIVEYASNGLRIPRSLRAIAEPGTEALRAYNAERSGFAHTPLGEAFDLGYVHPKAKVIA